MENQYTSQLESSSESSFDSDSGDDAYVPGNSDDDACVDITPVRGRTATPVSTQLQKQLTVVGWMTEYSTSQQQRLADVVRTYTSLARSPTYRVESLALINGLLSSTQ